MNYKDLQLAAMSRLGASERRFLALQRELVEEDDPEVRREICRQMAIVARTISNERVLIEHLRMSRGRATSS